jgi:anti-sigma factor RsiW
MTCRELAELLIDYLDGELAEEMCGTIRAHLHDCPECVYFIETYQLTIRISRRLPGAEMPPGLLDKVRKALDEE